MARSWSGCRGDGISCERREDSLREAVERAIGALEVDEARRGRRRDMGEEGEFITSMGGVGRSRKLCMLLCNYRAGASLLVGAVGEL